MGLSTRMSPLLLCSSCVRYRSAYIMARRNFRSQTLLNSHNSVEKKVREPENKVKKFKASSQIQSPSLLALKLARQSNGGRTLSSSESDKSSTNDLKLRLENLFVQWDDKKSLPYIISDEALQHSFDGDQDEAVESIILPTDLVRNTKPSPLLGTEDRDVPRSNIPCAGCGAFLQCQHSTFPGFLPSEYFKILSEREMKISICQRCYYIRHCDAFKEVSTDLIEYKSVISKIQPTQSLVLLIVDVMDMRGSIVPNLMDYIGDSHPLIVVGNKADLLSPDCQGYLGHVRDVLKSTCYSAGLSNIRQVILASAKTGFGIERLISMLFAYYKQKVDVYIVGTANTGKSSLFNTLLASDYCKSSARTLIERATVSMWPGET
ncbi:nitric oxide-associated protein 1 [Elysia marginata]|uniref:Nitric oxide-associated protein 1 n=1 Tax=Elysia marginata TaxID=1093978 RepID=A0AAV4ETI9_9GAST|nr:nitric oxide-associated protein 1 [Elysia marginata]